MDYEGIFYIVSVILSAITAVITFVRTGTIKKEFKKDMLYRSPGYQESLSDEEKKKQSQSFDNLKTEYVLNKNKNELEEKPDKTDLQSLINSSIDTALDRVLQRLMPESQDIESEIESEYDAVSDDLIDYAEILDRAEDYRERFNLPLEMSVDDIYKHVQSEADGLKTRLDNLRKPQQAAKETPEDETQKTE
ncbi:hypothetical protein [Dipodfec virus UOA04_Rod_1056]|nr:hypothetical protein [Dipodfec virus UOA04_Rod_1056]